MVLTFGVWASVKRGYFITFLKRLCWPVRFLRFGLFIDGVDGNYSNNSLQISDNIYSNYCILATKVHLGGYNRFCFSEKVRDKLAIYDELTDMPSKSSLSYRSKSGRSI